MRSAGKNPMNTHPGHAALAEALWQAAATRTPIAPLRQEAERLGVPLTVGDAYAIQQVNRARRIQAGDRIVGRKIGLTSQAVQRQLGVDQPDFGDLWAADAHADGDEVALAGLLQPKVEAEVALVMGRELNNPMALVSDVIRATEFALSAIEIVDSRIAQWQIGLFDTIADNASGGAFVLGADPVKLSTLRLRDARMVMRRGELEVSSGIGSACLGHPLNAAAWLARTLARSGQPLREGDVVLTGALGPMVSAVANATFEARIEGLGAVAVRFA